MIHYRVKHDPQSSHRQIVRIIKQMHRGPILDVGSAQGMLGRALEGTGLVIDAIEPDSRWAAAANPFYRRVLNCTVENAELPPQQYDVIVCADVLEHLADPVAVLGRLAAAAQANAQYIISLPNVAHLSVRLLLMAGSFPRMDRGVLDKTHLQFFTRSSAVAMLSEAGLKVLKISATPVPLEEITSSRIINAVGGALQGVLVRLFPTLFAYQWIFIAGGKGV